MKTFVKKSLLWFFSLLFVVCSAFTITAFTQKGVLADEEQPVLNPKATMIQGASIRDGSEDGVTGLRFAWQCNSDWFTANPLGTYKLGMLIFPAEKMGEDFAFDPEVAPETYAEQTSLDAAIVTDLDSSDKSGNHYGSIVYDRDTVAAKVGEENVDLVLKKLYAMDLTAVAFAKNAETGKYYYSEPYTTSMTKVASRIVAGEVETSETVVKLAESYLGEVTDAGKAYVLNGSTVVAGLNAQNVASVVIGNEYVDFTVEGGVLSIPAEVANKYAAAENNADQYANVYLFDESNNLTIVNVLFGVDQVIDSPAEFKSVFVQGSYDASKTYENNYGTYVLGADIDLVNEGVLSNSYDRTLQGGISVFYGIFDGFGYSVNNATVDCDTTGYYPAGLLGDFGKDSILANIAFNNMAIKKVTANTSWATLTGSVVAGFVENVYVHLNDSVPYGIGVFGICDTTALFTNVVVKADRPEGFKFERSANNYFDFAGRVNQGVGFGSTNSKNIIVIANNSPLGYVGHVNQIGTNPRGDYLYYGENESKHWFKDYEGYSDETFFETASYYDGNQSKNVIVKGAYRYNTLEELNAVINDETVTKKPDFAAMLASKMFKVDMFGNFVWHSVLSTKQINTEVDFDAETNTLRATDLPENISKVTVTTTKKDGSQVVTVLTPGSGLDYVEATNSYQFTGVPKFDNAPSGVKQVMTFDVESTEGFVYSYTNVVYNNFIIDNVADFKAFIEYDYAAGTTNYYFYKLATDLNLSGETFPLRKTNYYGYSIYQAARPSFGGVFDGDGHVISNFNQGVGGMFAALREPAQVKDFALVDLGAGPIFGTVMVDGSHTYGASLSNIYVSYADGIKPQGLFNNTSYGGEFGYAGDLKVTNVVIDTTGYNNSIAMAKDNAAYGITADHVVAYPTVDKVSAPFALINAIRPNSSTSAKLRPATDIENAFENVILIGNAPAISAVNKAALLSADLFNHELKDGVYTHTYKNYTDIGSMLNFTGWPAGNLTTADMPMPTSLKAGFAQLAANNAGTTLAGYICKTCYKGFSLTAGTCSCGATLTQSADLWKEIGSYNWTLYDLTTHSSEGKLVQDGNMKLAGVSKYVDESKMPTDAEAYKAFTSTGLWKVVEGKLTWKNIYTIEVPEYADIELSTIDANKQSVDFAPQFKVDGVAVVPTVEVSSDCVEIKDGKIIAKAIGSATVTLSIEVAGKSYSANFTVNVTNSVMVDDVVDFEASSGLLKTTAYAGTINKITVTAYDVKGNAVTKVLTPGNGILEGGKLNALTSYADTYGDAIGVPYADNLVSANVVSKLDNKGIQQQMKFVIETTEGTYTFNNVMYYNDIIDNTTEFKADVADWDYLNKPINAGYYKLGTDIDAAGLSYARNTWNNIFGYPAHATYKYYGFRGRFDGDGHVISNFTPAQNATHEYGLFGGLMVEDDHTQTHKLATQIVIKNVAFVDIGSGPVIARYAPTTKTSCFFDANAPITLLENIYVSVKENETLRGLFGGKGSWPHNHNLISMNIGMKNILIDATKANVKLAKDNAVYGDQFKDAKYANVADFQESYAIYAGWCQPAYNSGFTDEKLIKFIEESLNNVVILGNVPVALNAKKAPTDMFTHADNGDGTYTHGLRKLAANETYAYASNQTMGDLPIVTGIRDSYSEGLDTDNGSSSVWTNVAAYKFGVRDLTAFENDIPDFSGEFKGNNEFVLNGVYKYYDGNIKTNEVDLEDFTSTNFWKTVNGKLTWKSIYSVEFDAVEDVELNVLDSNNKTKDFAPQVTVDGQKYAVTDITADSDCITIKDGKITANSVGSAVVTLKYTVGGKVYTSTVNVNVIANLIIDDVVDFEGSTGLLKTTAISGDIQKVTVTAYRRIPDDKLGDAKSVGTQAIVKELTLGNSGILAGGKFNALTNYTDTYGDVAGVPYADNVRHVTGGTTYGDGIMQQMVFVVETTAGTFTFNNVMYYNEIIENETEFKALMDWDYGTTVSNANYYKLGADIDAAGLSYDRTNWSGSFGYAYQKNAGFRGRFDGDGHVVKNFDPSTYGFFGGFGSVYSSQRGATPTQIVVKNLAFENIGTGPVFARFISGRIYDSYDNNDEPGIVFENIYVQVAEGATIKGLIGGSANDNYNLGNGNLGMKNIVIDTTKANVKLAKDNSAFLIRDDEGNIVNQFEGTNVVDFQDSYAIFGNWARSGWIDANIKYLERFTTTAFDNVVILGNAPVALRRSTMATQYQGKNNTWAVKQIVNEDGTYSYVAKDNLDNTDVYAYACNQTVGDIPLVTGLKPAFAAQVVNNDATTGLTDFAEICYVCGLAKVWSVECPNCGANTNGKQGGWIGNNQWNHRSVYTYTLRDLTNFKNPTTDYFEKCEVVLQGVYKYNDGAIKANEVNLDAFTSTGFWSVVDGSLVFGKPVQA